MARTHLRLIIGNKTYSSWSMRPWLLLQHHEIPFEELRLPLDTAEFRRRIGALSPSGRVPVLHDGRLVVWDSLAIVEYVNEAYLEGRGWPTDRSTRARARSAVAELHSGFSALRAELPMNLKRAPRAVPTSPAAAADIARVQALWSAALEHSKGPFLFGDFGIADAFYAPVATRFRTYAVPLCAVCAAYCERLHALPALRQWYAEAAQEVESLPEYDAR